MSSNLPLVRQSCRGRLKSAASGPRVNMTEVEAHMALVCASTDDSRPLTAGTNLIWTMVDGG